MDIYHQQIQDLQTSKFFWRQNLRVVLVVQLMEIICYSKLDITLRHLRNREKRVGIKNSAINQVVLVVEGEEEGK